MWARLPTLKDVAVTPSDGLTVKKTSWIVPKISSTCDRGGEAEAGPPPAANQARRRWGAATLRRCRLERRLAGVARRSADLAHLCDVLQEDRRIEIWDLPRASQGNVAP